jgi:hypothetical protein
MTEVFDRLAFTTILDAALNDFRGRELVHSSEICNVLLDLRLTLVESTTPTDLSQLLSGTAAPQ